MSYVELKCEAACEEHTGTVRPVKVIDDVFRVNFDFDYCDTAVEEDRGRGYKVHDV